MKSCSAIAGFQVKVLRRQWDGEERECLSPALAQVRRIRTRGRSAVGSLWVVRGITPESAAYCSGNSLSKKARTFSASRL
jgi:hypothetical protein